MSRMDLDDDGFDDFDDLVFNPDDFKILDRETEQYLSSQMHVDQSNAQLNKDAQLTEAQSTIEELRHKLLLVENDNKRLENKLRGVEESVRLKEHDLIQLKRKYAKQTSESVAASQPKRAFPGAPFPQIKTKYKRTTTSSFIRDESMPLVSRSPTPSLQTDASIADVDMRSQSVVLDSVVKPETVATEPPIIIHPQERVIIREKPEPVVKVQMKPKIVVKKVPKHNDSYNELLMILFADVFKEWNESSDFASSLTPARIQQFSSKLAAEFVPVNHDCPAETIQQLKLIATEMKDTVTRSVDTESTIRFLLIQFNACLSIGIEYKLYDIVHKTVALVNELTAYYDVVKDQFYKELLLNARQSTLHKLVQCLSLYDFKTRQPKASQVIIDYPDIASSNYSRSKQIADKYGAFSSIIAEAIHRSPHGAQQAMVSILEILSRVGKHFQKPIFIFLLEDKGFLNLLSSDVPMELLNKVFSVLQTNFTDKNWISHYDYSAMNEKNYSCDFVIRLTNLINMPQKSLTSKNWYLVRRRMVSILKELCSVQLPEFISTWIRKQIYTGIIDLMIRLCEFSRLGKRMDEIKDHELLVKEGFLTIYIIMKIDCSSLFDEHSEYTASKLQDLVNYYLEKVTHDQHPARNVLLCIEGVIDSLMES